MNKSCSTCARREECLKLIGLLFGYCEIDYVEEVEPWSY